MEEDKTVGSSPPTAQLSAGQNGEENDGFKGVFQRNFLKQLYRTKELVDVVLLAKKGKLKVEFQAHKAILAATSKFFWEMFVNLRIQDVLKIYTDPENLKAVLEFIYEGHLSVNEENAGGLYEAGNLMDITGVKDKCLEYMMLNVDDGNWDRRLKFARVQGCDTLLDLVTDYVSRDCEHYLKTPQFLDLEKSDVLRLVKISAAKGIPGQVIFNYALSWLKFKEAERHRDAADVMGGLELSSLPQLFLQETFENERVLNSFSCAKVFQEAVNKKLLLEVMNPQTTALNSPPTATVTTPASATAAKKLIVQTPRTEASTLIELQSTVNIQTPRSDGLISPRSSNPATATVPPNNLLTSCHNKETTGTERCHTAQADSRKSVPKPGMDTTKTKTRQTVTPDSSRKSVQQSDADATKTCQTDPPDFRKSVQQPEKAVRFRETTENVSKIPEQPSAKEINAVEEAEEPAEKRLRADDEETASPAPVPPIRMRYFARKSTGGVKKTQYKIISKPNAADSPVVAVEPPVATPAKESGVNCNGEVDKISNNSGSADPSKNPSSSPIAPAVPSATELATDEPLRHPILYLREWKGQVRVMMTDLRRKSPRQLRHFIGNQNPTLIWSKENRRLYILGGIASVLLEVGSSKEVRYSAKTALLKSSASDKYWYRGPPMNQERANFQAVILGDFIYAFGGAEGICGNEAVNCAERLSMVKKSPQWEEIDFLQRSRHTFGAGVIQDKIYVCGGYGSQDGSKVSSMGILNSVECYDPAKDEWTFLASMLRERFGHASVVLNNKLYAIGGGGINYHTNPSADVENMRSVEVYDPLENSWTQISPMNRPRKSASAVVSNGKIYVIGGDMTRGENDVLSSVEVYNPVHDKWTMFAEAIDDCGYFSSVAVMEEHDDSSE